MRPFPALSGAAGIWRALKQPRIMTGFWTDGSRRRQRDGAFFSKKQQAGDLVNLARSMLNTVLQKHNRESHNAALLHWKGPAEEENRKSQAERRQVGGQGAQTCRRRASDAGK